MDELKATYFNKNPLIRIFSKMKVNIAVKMAELKKKDFILDFGCGAGWLKNKLRKKEFNVVGYDITPEHSDVADYTKIKPDKIFAMDVFEHIPEKDIREIIRNFKKMNPDFELITSIPTENLLSRKARKFFGKTERVKGHVTSLKRILKILNDELKLIKRFNFLGVSWIGKFKSREQYLKSETHY